MANGGNARDRRRMRRMVRQIFETYGLPARQSSEPTETKQSPWDFVLKYALPAVTLASLGPWISDASIILASTAYLLAVAIIFRGFWSWCDTKRKIIALLISAVMAVLVFAWFDYKWIKEEWTPTFLYLVPTHELIDCERRAFFVNHSGLKSIQNVEIVIKDNKTGAVQKNEDFRAGIEPGPQNPDAPRYIWLKPSHPWDEDYTITVTGTKFHSVQQTILRSAKKSVQFAAQITVEPKNKPVVSCRDSLLPEAYSLARGASTNCDRLMAVEPAFLSNLQPEFYGFQHPNGDFTSVRIRKLPSASDLDSQSEERHLTEYQQTTMKHRLSRYRGTKLLIFYAGGKKTLAYATEFRDFFRSLAWHVDGPRLVPIGDEELVDVQISVSNRYWNSPYPRAADLQSSLEGIKHRQGYVYDDKIPSDLIVLWVGPKSPANFKPDDCAPAALRPKPGDPLLCENVAQVVNMCPFPPQ